MKEFMYLFRGGDARRSGQSPEEAQQHMDQWVQWMQQLAQDGVLKAGQPLQTGGKVVEKAGEIVTDGPFAEGKEVVGGFLIVKAETIEQAVEISKGCPIFEYGGTTEVREILEM